MLLWKLRKARSGVFGIFVLALTLESCLVRAAISVPQQVQTLNTAASMRAADVALKRGGVLRGQVVNNAGIGIARATVELTSGRQRWQTETDEQGWFQVAELSGGTYQLRVAGQTQVLRVWSAGTAPPSASQGVLVTPSTEIVRGQRVVAPKINQFFRVNKRRLANPWILGGVVATAVSIPVAIHNANDDDPPATP
ncbi:MAG: carboxypeptidase regulatory-like domain-containing protein [Planctomycetes bacterium]|nr:carboxypeptidase regulatory-like domain-containing protein [Planctomycetota bacterium]